MNTRPGKCRPSRHCDRDEQDGGDKGSSGKTTSESGQEWTFQSHRGLWKTKMEAAGCEITGGQRADKQISQKLKLGIFSDSVQAKSFKLCMMSTCLVVHPFSLVSGTLTKIRRHIGIEIF